MIEEVPLLRWAPVAASIGSVGIQIRISSVARGPKFFVCEGKSNQSVMHKYLFMTLSLLVDYCEPTCRLPNLLMMYVLKSALSLTTNRPLLQSDSAGAFDNHIEQKQVSRLACPVCLAGHG
jgi:hypothetical protein